MILQFSKQINHLDRMWILSNFAYLCYLYNLSIDSESVDLVKQWIDKMKSMKKGMLSEGEWEKFENTRKDCESSLRNMRGESFHSFKQIFM